MQGPRRRWKRKWVWLTSDRLCFTSSQPGTSDRAHYIPLDRVPVRALPRGYGPQIGVHLVEDRQVAAVSKRRACTFSIQCGGHTHFFAADTACEAKEWVERITAVWVHCVKHAERRITAADSSAMITLQHHQMQAEIAELRKFLSNHGQQASMDKGQDNWLVATQQQAETLKSLPADSMVYEVQVVTGTCRGAGTDARVYCEIFGNTRRSGEFMLHGPEGGSSAPFQQGATDLFKISCAHLGSLCMVRILHDNSGRAPGWYCDVVRIREQGLQDWTVFPCYRWLAVDMDDRRIVRDLRVGAPAPAQEITSSDKPPSQPHAFLQGQQYLSCERPALCPLLKLTISHNQMGDARHWRLESVDVTDDSMGQITHFPCHHWLSKPQVDGHTERAAATGPGKQPAPDRLDVQSDARVYVDVTACASGDGPGHLGPAHDNLEQHHTDTFVTDVADVIPVTHTRVWRDSFGPSAAWHLADQDLERGGPRLWPIS
ncbi:hypothetical protein WJX72_008565 [[Myrmecia] bisecta]|uniref:PH domain-containing protein n=1 Tax=[Myrmecia] bisecta TaxID=41462 RepID=A0AAW1PUA6_9CHLO